ncbi:MAG TPA: rhodanese-like domain-containing protein [Blastocatellia bacterium]|nr:rhodanese-like domain-containing protein [Blastocatellia bacterium]
MPFGIISVTELKSAIHAGRKFRLIDVREPGEYDIARIDGAELKPLGQIATWAQQLPDKDEEIILHCHHGMRSAQACEFLSRQGFTNVKNLSGGIDAWSRQVDPTVPLY